MHENSRSIIILGAILVVWKLLDPADVRVLGALLEKEAATPEYYPLSLNRADQRVQPGIQFAKLAATLGQL